jgi:hypothetical protein
LNCPNCGVQNPDGAQQCSNCGNIFEAERADESGFAPDQYEQTGHTGSTGPGPGQPGYGQGAPGQYGQPQYGQPGYGQGPPGFGQPPPPSGYVQVPNYLVQSILVTLFCCLPLGIPAIVFSAQVNGKLAAGDWVGAQQASKMAKTWCWVSFGVGAAIGLFYLIAIVLGLAAEMST